MEHCAIFSHYTNIAKVLIILESLFGPSAVTVEGNRVHWSAVVVTTDKKLFKTGNRMRINFRQRVKPGFRLEESVETFMADLIALHGMIDGIKAENAELKSKLMEKVSSVNTEFAVSAEPAFTSHFKKAVYRIANAYDSVIFSNPNSMFDTEGFYNREGELIMDKNGQSRAPGLKVVIENKYFETSSESASKSRKERTEIFLKNRLVPVNPRLPHIVTEEAVNLKPLTEIARRVTVLAVLSSVGFDSLAAGEAADFLKKFNLWEHVTPNEKDFLKDPTADRKEEQTWENECIWVLMWVLKKVDDLGFPDTICDLNLIHPDDYPIRGLDTDPNEFIDSVTQCRTVSDILDAVDLYYRLEWACAEARSQGVEIERVDPGVVYERHYTLNWLVNHLNREWDDVICDV